MWGNEATNRVFDDMCSLACSKHKESIKKLPNFSKLQRTKKNMFWLMKIHVMEPFYYSTPYVDLPDNWHKNSGLLPVGDSFISCGHRNPEIIEKIILFDNISTHTLSLLSQSCCICEEIQTEEELLDNYEAKLCLEYDNHMTIFDKLELNPALEIIRSLSIYKEVEENFVACDKTIVDLAFLMSYYFFLQSSNDPSSSLCFIEKITDNAKNDVKAIQMKACGNEEYKKQNYGKAVEAYSFQLTFDCYNYICFGNRAQCFLKLNMFQNAELDCRAAIILQPEWCKAHYRHAQALVGQKKLQEAIRAAELGVTLCESAPSSEYSSLVEYKDSLKKECDTSCNSSVVEEKHPEVEVKKIVPLDSGDMMDVPELIESSDSDVSEAEETEKPVKEAKSPDVKDVPELIDSYDSDASTVEDAEKPIEEEKSPSFKDVPELVDTSESDDSETEESKKPDDLELPSEIERKIMALEILEAFLGQDIPELTDCRNNELHRNVRAAKLPPSKVHSRNKESRKTQKVPPKQEPVEDQVELEKMKLTRMFLDGLAEGSSAMASGNSFIAKQHFGDALMQLKSHQELSNLLNTTKLVTLKYAFGIACCKTGTFENIQTAISVFKEVVDEHPEVIFPATLYGLALSYFKMNDFKKSLDYLKMLCFAIEQLGELFEMEVHYWPETKDPIEETSTSTLKALAEDLMKECECPPPPDAVCRYEKCSQRPSIYFSDPNYKGFISVRCIERCLLQYHISCWKAVKETFDKTDKEFIDFHCLTPDCRGFIILVESIGKDGSVEKFFESEARINKKLNTKHKKTKLEKKFEIREQRKQKRHKSESQEKPVDEVSGQTVETVAPVAKPEVVEKTLEKEKISNAENIQVAPSRAPSELSATAKPFYIIKKDVENKPPETKQKHKEKKKQKKSTYSIDEFCSEYAGKDISYYNEYQVRLHRLQETRRVIEENDPWTAFCEAERIPDLDPNRPYYIPEGLRNDPDTLESVLQLCSTVSQNESSKQMKDFIYLRFENILQERGPLNVEDPVITEELRDLPLEWQEIINECGGFKSFMLQSMKFAVVDDTLCFFSDMLHLYQSSQINELDDFTHIYGSTDNGLGALGMASSHTFAVEESISDLNPNAVEYSPSDSASDISLNAGPFQPSGLMKMPDLDSLSKDVPLSTSFSVQNLNTSSDSSGTVVESEPSIISVLSNLRKPLQVSSSSCLSDKTENVLKKSLSAHALSSLATETKDPEVEGILTKLDDLKTQLCSPRIPWAAFDTITEISAMLKSHSHAEKIKQYVSHNDSILQQHPVHVLVDVCVQAGSAEVRLLSTGCQTTDDDFKMLQASYACLIEENEMLKGLQESLRQELIEIKEAYAVLKNKLIVEIPALENQLSENEEAHKEEKKSLKQKIAIVEKELKQWRQKHDLLAENEKQYTKENTKLSVRLNNCYSKLEDMEKKCEEYERKICNQNDIVEKCQNVIQENGELLEKKLKECVDANERAVKAEVELITVLKNTHLQKLDVIIKNGSQTIQELQKSLVMSENTMPPFLVRSLMLMLEKLKEHAKEISNIRFATVNKSEELMAKVQSGVPFSDLGGFPFPTLPEMPCAGDLMFPQASLMVPGGQQNSTEHNSYLAASNTKPGTADSSKNFPSALQPGFQSYSNPLTKPITNFNEIQRAYQSTLDPNLYMSQFPGFSPLLSQGINPYAQTPASNLQTPLLFPPAVPTNTSTAASYTHSTPDSSSKFPVPAAASVGSQPVIEKQKSEVADLTNSMSKAGASSTDSSYQLPPIGSSLSRRSSGSSEYAKSYHDAEDSASVHSWHSFSLPTTNRSNAVSNDSLKEAGSSRSQAGSVTAGYCEVPNGRSSFLELDYTTANDPVPSFPSNLGASKQSSSKASTIVPQKSGEVKNNYYRIIEKLQPKHPDLSENDLMVYLKEFRNEKVRLTGMTVQSIVNGVSEHIEKSLMSKQPNAPVMRAKIILNKSIASFSQPEPPKPAAAASSGNPWKKPPGADSSGRAWSGDNSDKCCIICLEEMTDRNSMKVDCGHQFHRACIKQWLNKTSSCPTCRVHLLLPEDYPALN